MSNEPDDTKGGLSLIVGTLVTLMAVFALLASLCG